MLVKTFNIRMDPKTLQFDDVVLAQFVREHDVSSLKTQFFFYKEEPIWSVMVTYRSLSQKTALQKYMDVSTGSSNSKPSKEHITLTKKQEDIYHRLRLWRNETARTIGHPPSNVFNNQQLREIVQLHPTSIHQLVKINGIGNYKSTTYGREILALLSEINSKTDDVEDSSTSLTSGKPPKGESSS